MSVNQKFVDPDTLRQYSKAAIREQIANDCKNVKVTRSVSVDPSKIRRCPARGKTKIRK